MIFLKKRSIIKNIFMRLKVILGKEDKWYRFPWGYPYYISSSIYNLLYKLNPELGFFWHSVGFEKKGKKFKLFTFSPFLPQKFIAKEDSCYLLAPMSLYISSPIEEFIERIIEALKMEKKITILGYDLPIISLKEIPVFLNKKTIQLKTLSPLTVSKKVKLKEKTRSFYLTPDHEDFIPRIKDNLIEKFSILYDFPPEKLEVKIKIYSYRTKLIEIKNIKIRGILMEFEIEAPKELIKFGYEAGLGEKTSMGFGFVEEL